jgi:ribonucleoside-triphosphate reductase (thioredoxin)
MTNINPNEILSDITVHMKYAKYNPELQRRETWVELCDRNMDMHIKKYPNLEKIITNAYNFVKSKKILPSMRSMQFAGKPIELSPNRIYNCAYMPIDNIAAFSESMFLLLGGTGVGYSVQKHHVSRLPSVIHPNPNRNRRYLVGDSIEGWSDAIKVLMKSYFGRNTSSPIFDYSDIRLKGERLITSGGKAPGPEPLKIAINKIEGILKNTPNHEQLSPIQVHDIMCHIADAVLAGGIRRAALISLFSRDDYDMLTAKSGNWWELNPQRGRANNSAVLVRSKVNKKDFEELWNYIEMSGAGEPGIYFTNDKDWGTNPCCEIALRPNQFCNLVEINASDVIDEDDLIKRAAAATVIATLQAGYTDFHYLREVWQKNTERDALIGVSMTGIASNRVKKIDFKVITNTIKSTNEAIAKEIGINPAARQTCVKPAGTTSCVLGTSSGIHAWHDEFYIRRIRVGKNEAIYNYLLQNHPELIEDEYFRPHDTAVISLPQKAPDKAILRGEETALNMLHRVKNISRTWVKGGHVSGMNSHNVSATVSIRKYEWDEVGEWMWDNRKYYNGLSVLPYDGGTYKQAPFETIRMSQYKDMINTLTAVDLSKIIETKDDTDLSGEIACSGDSCEIF